MNLSSLYTLDPADWPPTLTVTGNDGTTRTVPSQELMEDGTIVAAQLAVHCDNPRLFNSLLADVRRKWGPEMAGVVYAEALKFTTENLTGPCLQYARTVIKTTLRRNLKKILDSCGPLGIWSNDDPDGQQQEDS